MDEIKVVQGTATVYEGAGTPETISMEEFARRKKEEAYASRKDSFLKYPLYQKDPNNEAYYGSTSTSRTPQGYMRQTVTAADFIDVPSQLWGSDPEEFGNLSKTLKNIPGFDNDGSVEDVTSKFEGFLEMMSRSGLQMDPFDGLNYFEQLAKAQGYDPNKGRGGGGATTRSIVNLTNKFDAEALVNGALNSYLGRDASEQEISEFWKKLNKAEKKNPTISGPSGTKGGYNSSLAAEQYAETRDDYAETQAETTFKGLMEKAIRSRMSGSLEGML